MREIWYNYLSLTAKKQSHTHGLYHGLFFCWVISCFILKVFPSCATSYCRTSLFFSHLLWLHSCVPLVFCISSPTYCMYLNLWFPLWFPVCCVPTSYHFKVFLFFLFCLVSCLFWRWSKSNIPRFSYGFNNPNQCVNYTTASGRLIHACITVIATAQT